IFGSPAIASGHWDVPGSPSRRFRADARPAERPVTIKARCPKLFAIGPISRRVPAPKTIRVAVANSKRVIGESIYHPASSGKTLLNFALLRGSAIIGATVSRHRA